MMKRWRARARGRVARIKKRTCHITVKVAEIPAADGARGNREVPPAESKASKKAPAKQQPEEATE
jgi:large subunit ribosomal protein L22